MNSKTLIIYCGHEINENLIFFCRNGYIDDPKYDFIFVFNNPRLKLEFNLEKPNIKVIFRENIGYDFGAWTEILYSRESGKSEESEDYLYKKYNYFIFLNSTVRGPFLPAYYDQKKIMYWPDLFTSKINNNVKLVGPAVVYFSKKPFISSAFLATDRIGLEIGINDNIFHFSTIKMNKNDIIIKKELGLSKAILKAGYNIVSMLQYYKNVDLSKHISPISSICHLNPDRYFGININPYEIIFIKTNRNIEPLVIQKYTEWSIKKINNITKATYGNSEIDMMDVTNKIKEYFENKYVLETNLNLNNLFGKDPSPGKSKKLYIYFMDDTIEKVKILEESGSCLKTNLIVL